MLRVLVPPLKLWVRLQVPDAADATAVQECKEEEEEAGKGKGAGYGVMLADSR